MVAVSKGSKKNYHQAKKKQQLVVVLQNFFTSQKTDENLNFIKIQYYFTKHLI